MWVVLLEREISGISETAFPVQDYQTAIEFQLFLDAHFPAVETAVVSAAKPGERFPDWHTK